jgi:hypothetical protein
VTNTNTNTTMNNGLDISMPDQGPFKSFVVGFLDYQGDRHEVEVKASNEQWASHAAWEWIEANRADFREIEFSDVREIFHLNDIIAEALRD